mmetsp:Transcript_9964/g.28321  ORF Transcript_9964/g.28321 Transcript_9964/m.28321 type:complete len:249 (-) Transcript_9964:117-863(-)
MIGSIKRPTSPPRLLSAASATFCVSPWIRLVALAGSSWSMRQRRSRTSGTLHATIPTEPLPQRGYVTPWQSSESMRSSATCVATSSGPLSSSMCPSSASCCLFSASGMPVGKPPRPCWVRIVLLACSLVACGNSSTPIQIRNSASACRGSGSFASLYGMGFLWCPSTRSGKTKCTPHTRSAWVSGSGWPAGSGSAFPSSRGAFTSPFHSSPIQPASPSSPENPFPWVSRMQTRPPPTSPDSSPSMSRS